jgi:hypothetical protein
MTPLLEEAMSPTISSPCIIPPPIIHRSRWRAAAAVLLVVATLGLLRVESAAQTTAPSGERYQGFIAAAGNAETDSVRLRHLRKLANQCAADSVQLEGLDRLIEFIDRWDSMAQRLDFFNGQVQRTRDYDFGIKEDSPLYPIAAFYRARMLVWVTLEYSDIYPYPDKRASYLSKAKALFEIAAKAFPDNRVARMYLGDPFPPEKKYDSPPGAPVWAVSQREGLERLTDVIDWWIDHRMRPNGEYGGGWGDDCEMWRHWVPVLVGFDYPKANWAQTYLSKQLLSQPHLAGGYHNRLMDVEHTSEDVSDALTAMMFIDAQNPESAARVQRLADLMENLWTGRNQRGFLQFKSTYFTSEQVDQTPARACDTVYHARAMQPALLYWQRTADPRLTRLFSDWARTWVDAAAREERGKPAGILPTAIHWPDGQIGGVGEKWWMPENYNTPLYDFPSAMSMMLNTLLLTHHMTGDPAFLQPIRSMATARLEWLNAGQPTAPEGSRFWCAARLDFLGDTVAKYRFLTGDKSFDELLRKEEALPYVQYRLGEDVQGLNGRLERVASVLRMNFPAYTQEVRYTDRVFRFPVLYEPGWMLENGAAERPLVIEAGVMAMGVNRLMLLYNTVTGDPGDPLYFPMNAVRWRTPPRDLAALVTDATTRHFDAKLYHFGAADRKFDCELLLLAPGKYEYSLTEVGSGKTVGAGQFAIDVKTRRLPITLPKQVECRLQVNAQADGQGAPRSAP